MEPEPRKQPHMNKLSSGDLIPVQLGRGKEKPVIQGHPWIFTGALKKIPTPPQTTWATLYNPEGIALGVGLFEPDESLCFRMFFPDQNQIPSHSQLCDRIVSAFNRRKFSSLTDAYRLIHAEGDLLPGLILDKYNTEGILSSAYTSLPENLIQAFASCASLAGLQSLWLRLPGQDSQKIAISQNPPEADASGLISAEPPEAVIVLEEGIPLYAPLRKGQKTGLFLDQRDNRQNVRAHAQDKSVLNLFAYTGGFSLAALEGGAKQVTSVDVSKEALAWGQKSVQAWLDGNKTKKDSLFTHEDRAEWVVADCFEYLRQPGPCADLVIVDPPAFAKSKQALENAARGYKDINRLALLRTAPKGLFYTFSCSQKISLTLFQQIIFSAALEAKRTCRIIQRLGAGSDHPVSLYCPEGEYLKGLLLEVD